MSTARRALAAFLAAAVAPGCASTLTLQDTPVTGREVTVVPAGKESKLEGELLVVEKDRLWLRTSNGVRELPLSGVSEVRVKRHGFGARQALTWTGIGAALSGIGMASACSSVEGSSGCGGWGLGTAGVWLLVGALSAPAFEASSRIRYPTPSADTLRPYARLPQGLAAGVAPTSLAEPSKSGK